MEILALLRTIVEKGSAPARVKALLVLSNMLSLKIIDEKAIDWLPPLVGEVPEKWTLNEYCVALPLLRDAGYPIGELTCDVWKKVRGDERQPVGEWIVRNALSLGIQTHIHISPARQST